MKKWKPRIIAILKDPRVRPIEVWAVRAILLYLTAKTAAPHKVP